MEIGKYSRVLPTIDNNRNTGLVLKWRSQTRPVTALAHIDMHGAYTKVRQRLGVLQVSGVLLDVDASLWFTSVSQSVS